MRLGPGPPGGAHPRKKKEIEMQTAATVLGGVLSRMFVEGAAGGTERRENVA